MRCATDREEEEGTVGVRPHRLSFASSIRSDRVVRGLVGSGFLQRNGSAKFPLEEVSGCMPCQDSIKDSVLRRVRADLLSVRPCRAMFPRLLRSVSFPWPRAARSGTVRSIGFGAGFPMKMQPLTSNKRIKPTPVSSLRSSPVAAYPCR